MKDRGFDLLRGIKILRHLSKVACALVAVAIALNGAHADMPASQVYVQTVQQNQSYPEVPANGEGWFDVGGFCKVVDVGDLSALGPTAKGVPVFIPGPAAQWENYRTLAGTHYNGQLTLTTCCRPASQIITLCATGTNPQSVSLQYGKYGEVDPIAASCIDSMGASYTESVNITCQGTTGTPSVDNGPDGQAVWHAGIINDTCAPNAFTSLGTCTAPGNCGTGSQSVTVLDSCGNVTSSTNQACNTGVACCTPGQSVNCGACGSNGTTSCTDSCGNVTTQTCSRDECPETTVTWEEDANGQANLCSATLAAESWKARGSYSVSQSPTASNKYYTGQISYPLQCLGDIFVTNGPVVPTWSYGNTDGNYVPLGQRDSGTKYGYPPGSCYPAQCEGTVTWSVGGNSCSAQNVAINENQTATVSTINNSPSEVGGTAQVTCNAQLQFTVLPGATCGPGQCVPQPGSAIMPDVCQQQCAGYVHTYDSCGNLISEQSCYTLHGCSSTCPAVANGTTGPAPGCAVTCNSGYTLSGGTCVASGGTCPAVANGPTSAYPACTITCNSGYTLSGGTCVASGGTCPAVANGTTSAYPACAITCNSGYTLSGGACVASGGGTCTGNCGINAGHDSMGNACTVAPAAVCPPANTLIGGCTCEATAPVSFPQYCAADGNSAACSTLFNYCSAVFSTGPSADQCSCGSVALPSSQCLVHDSGLNGQSTCCVGTKCYQAGATCFP